MRRSDFPNLSPHPCSGHEGHEAAQEPEGGHEPTEHAGATWPHAMSIGVWLAGMRGRMEPTGPRRNLLFLPPPTMQQNLAQMSRMLPPHLLKAMGGAGGLQNLMKQMEGKF